MSDIEIHLSQRLSDDDYHKITVAMSLAYRQGRADAIDEFVAKCKVKIQEQNMATEDECPFLDMIDIGKIAEQLKEKK